MRNLLKLKSFIIKSTPVIVALMWLYFISYALLDFHAYVSETPGVRTTASDFSAFWAAAVFAWNGMPLAAFDTAAMRELQANGTPPDSPPFWWLYPPGLMIALMPLGALSFIGAWMALVAMSMIALSSALARLRVSGLWLNSMVLFSPATLICLVRGQVAMLFAAAIILGFAELLRQREMRAAMWLSLVTLKPSLCIGFPVAFAAARSWRLIGFGLLFVVGLSVAPLPVVGFAYWAYWIEAIRIQSASFLSFPLYPQDSVTWAALFINVGLKEQAIALQWLLGGASLTMLAIVWASRNASVQLRGAALMFAMVSALPYGWIYEAIYPLVGALLLLCEDTRRNATVVVAWRRRAAHAIFVGLWLAPLAIFVGIPVSLVTAPLCLTALTCTLVMARTAGKFVPVETAALGIRSDEAPR